MRPFAEATQTKNTSKAASAMWDSFEEFAQTEPTTLAGLFAMLINAEEIVEGSDLDVLDDGEICSTMAAAARRLSKGGPAKAAPPLPSETPDQPA
jgi:hypothetical protein